MKKSLSLVSLYLGLTFSAYSSANEYNYPIDPVSGLIMAPNWELVNYQCNACHTSAIIPQNKGNKQVWRETIQWMIDTQGLWDLSDTWEPVLNYLSTYYNESSIDMSIFRRKFLTEEQMPAMPKFKDDK